MQSTQTENLPPPPGVISSIKAGFDAIAAHIKVILLPLLLDLFIWLGPRLRMNAMFDSMRNDLVNFWKSGGISTTQIQAMLDSYNQIIPVINLFWVLRTLPVGISSLVFPDPTSSTPLGTPSVLQVNAVNFLGWLFLLTLVGWIGGGLYFRSVAWRSVVPENEKPIGVGRAVVQTILLSIVCSILLFVIGMPVLLLLGVLLQVSEVVGYIAMFALSFISMWLIVPVFFWPHGIFVKRQNFLTAILSSVQMARFTLPTSSMFILTIFLLSVGLNYLWNIPPEDSWITLLGIFGHAFVTTALLAASFIYYRDMNLWLQSVLERLKARRGSLA
jgi:hypothetical protein